MEIAKVLKTQFRGEDIACRYGGEEFLVVLPDCDSVTSITRADQVRQRISAKPVIALGTQTFVTVSVGVAVFEPNNPIEIQSLLNQADAGLYRAKRQGRNQVVHAELVERQHESLQHAFESPQ